MVRLVSGVVLAVAALSAILFLPLVALKVLAVVVATLAAREYLTVCGVHDGPRQMVALVLTAALCWAIAAEWAIDPATLLLAALVWLAADVLFVGSPIGSAASSIMAPVYTGAPLGMLVVVHAAHGWRATVLLVATVIVSDSSQYYTGRAFGRRPLAPTISPKKTVEGAVGGVVCGSLFAVVAGQWVFPGVPLASLLSLGVSVVVLGICGDLFESRLKRAAGMKDSSALIPGHGGILDRIDALLFAAPAFYLFVKGLP